MSTIIQYDTDVMHAAASKIEQETAAAIEQHHIHYQKALATIDHLPAVLQGVMREHLDKIHQHHMRTYQESHQPLAHSIYDAAGEMRRLDQELA